MKSAIGGAELFLGFLELGSFLTKSCKAQAGSCWGALWVLSDLCILSGLTRWQRTKSVCIDELLDLSSSNCAVKLLCFSFDSPWLDLSDSVSAFNFLLASSKSFHLDSLCPQAPFAWSTRGLLDLIQLLLVCVILRLDIGLKIVTLLLQRFASVFGCFYCVRQTRILLSLQSFDLVFGTTQLIADILGCSLRSSISSLRSSSLWA